jgi:predicted alpha/beta hydrolase
MKEDSLRLKTARFPISPLKTTEIRYILAQNPRVEEKSILVIPALGVSASYYDGFIDTLALAGISAGVIDLQGQGNSAVVANRNIDFGYLDLINEDIASAIQFASTVLPGTLVLFGHSLGGQLLCLYLSQSKATHHRLILMTSCSVYYKCWPTFWSRIKVFAGTQLANFLAILFGYFPGNRLGFGGRTGRTVIKDWSLQARTGHYKLSGSKFDWEQALSGVTASVLSMSIDGDFLAPHRAADHLNNKLTSAEIYRVHLKQEGFNHFNWVKNSTKIVLEIEKWIRFKVI